MLVNKKQKSNRILGYFLLGIMTSMIFFVYPLQADQGWQKLVDEAGAAYEKGEPAKALNLLKGAVELTLEGTEARAAVLNNLAIVIEANGDLDGAESLYTRVIGLWAQLLGSDHPNVARTLGNLADLNHRRGQFDDALEAYQLAIATIDTNNSLEVKGLKRAVHVSYAKLLRELGRNTEADQVLKKVFKRTQ
ncbi:MAG: tetratricopeptide repeat protein [Alphaproteobacteria bacterium]|nr:tetratricopeptide repeat protein [Alphaproteobacteria bacterium]MDG1886552.1 tetratricopeptide repeat protein [Alphaproteobacteria bacterium]|tara:strand:- start:119 stop:694 length:576 start_codon:yes stop_codon:yes gene_type:complete